MNLKQQEERLRAIIAERPKTEALHEEMRMHDAGDMAMDLVEQNNATLVLDMQHMKKALARIALSKIADGIYETCSGCDGAIKPARLEAVPQAILCTRCQERSERGELSNLGATREDDPLAQYA